MSTEPQSRPNLWVQLLRDAVAEESVPEGPHFLDDDDFIDRWENQQLSAGEHDAFVEHLAACGYCRDVLTEMIRQGAIKLPALDGDASSEAQREQAPPHGPSVDLPTTSFTWNRLFTIALATAACVVLILVLRPKGNDIAGQLALVERELQTDPEAALARLEGLGNERLSPDARMKSSELAEQAGYRSARDRLTDGQFQQVGELEQRATQLGGRSGRLSNLRLQAERGIPGEVALSGSEDLTAYDYQLNGRNPTKAFGTGGDETTERWERDLRAAINDFPDDVSLRMNFGHLLLTLRRCDEAKEQFAKVLDHDPKNVLAHIGLGLADFEWNEDEQALQHFQDTILIDADNFAAHLNAAITLERLTRSTEARPYFERAKALAPNDKLRAEIDEHLSRS